MCSRLRRAISPLVWRVAGSWYFMTWGLSRDECERVPWGIMLGRFVRGWGLHPAPARRYARECASVGIAFNHGPPAAVPRTPQRRQRVRRRSRTRRDRKTGARVLGAVLGALLAFVM